MDTQPNCEKQFYLSKSKYSSNQHHDFDLLKEKRNLMITLYKKQFPNVKIEQFLDSTYRDIKKWHLNDKLNLVYFTGELGELFLVDILLKFKSEFPTEKLEFIVSNEAKKLEDFGLNIDSPQKPYLMHINEKLADYSRYLI